MCREAISISTGEKTTEVQCYVVVDTLSPLGVTHIDMPVTPKKVWRAIRAAHRRADFR